MGAGADFIDLIQLGRPGLIASWRVNEVLIDCGPAVCLAALLDGLAGWQPRALLLTHIHLDHAGAAGALVRRWPWLEVWVHERGARHLITPERLMDSAYRVFGPELDHLFGAMMPVPASNVHTLVGGERVWGLEVDTSPGHASHHVSYLDPSSGRAFPGDVAGVALFGGPVVPPTPPPDIDLQAWRTSLDRLEAWKPTSLGLPHFGEILDVSDHIARMRAALGDHEQVAATADRARYEAWYVDQLKGCSSDLVGDYVRLAPPVGNFEGLHRYLRNRQAPDRNR
jgi:glyoxylase-like metal-dependent hydrolase (beta-lactamase superfamily II)